MHPEWLENLKEKRDYLKKWLARHRETHEIAPEVQRNLELTEWQINTIESRPLSSYEIPLPDLARTAASDYEHLMGALPMIPRFDREKIVSGSAFTSTSTASVFEYASRVGDLDEPEAKEYSNMFTVSFRDLQHSHERPKQLRWLIERLGNPGTTSRLDRAVNSYSSYQMGTTRRTAVAIEIRNLIDGVKGDLFERARNWPTENMTWPTMAQRLSKGPENGPQFQELIEHERTHSSLISRLSDIAKDREAGSFTNLDNVWAETLEHLYAVLGLVDLEARG